MFRLIAVILLTGACISPAGTPSPTESGGQGAPTGGASGGTGGSPGTGGVPSTGGAPATGGAIGVGADSGSAPADGPMSIDAGPAGSSSDGGYMPGGDILPGRPYIHLCPKAWDQMKCCEFLCECVANYCADVPMDQTRIGHDACMTMCTKLSDARARCQVFHCFESKSPTAVPDHGSHCGHATGRVGGGDCSAVP